MANKVLIPSVLKDKLPPHLEKIKYGQYVQGDKDYPINLYLRENDIRIEENGSDIVQFLRGKNIFLTGATGFLGKLMVEKLLRSCKDIGTVYILVRTKKGKTPENRMKEYLDNWAFYPLSKIHPNFREKVELISGDLEEEGLGMSDDSRKLLQEKVNVIYHVGATVRFDEKLAKAIRINVKGTYQLIQLAKECKNLAVFCHVSTAYANCTNKHIKEEIYPPYLDPYFLMSLEKSVSDDVLDNITTGLLGSVPNTYVFTKQIAEDLVRREALKVPVCICRPAIVISSVREPIRSWIDNFYGPIGIIVATAVGLIHILYMDCKKRIDLVPADYTVNSCIAASYRTATERLDDIQIFNYTSSPTNSLYLEDLGTSSIEGNNVSSEKIIMSYFGRSVKYYSLYRVLHFIIHVIPAYIVDGVLLIMGKKPIAVAGYAKLNEVTIKVSYFTLHEWNFDRTNIKKLWQSLNETDKSNFSFNIDDLDWSLYFATLLVAIREFLLQEPLDNLEAGRKHHFRVNVISSLVFTLTLFLTTYYLINTMFFFIPVLLITVLLLFVFTAHSGGKIGIIL